MESYEPDSYRCSSNIVAGPSEQTSVPSSLSAGSCSRLLQQRCPACFGGIQFGRDFETYALQRSCGVTAFLITSLSHGGDIHVAIDATFSQRHNVAAGDSPWLYEPKYFISKDAVDSVGARISAARSKPPRAYKSSVPNTALDECEKSYEAANEKKDKSIGSKFDDTGLMALVCRHDMVLFLANVDTAGEQQKYSVALIEHLYSHLPEQATVAVYYDIGCVLDRSLHKVCRACLSTCILVDIDVPYTIGSLTYSRTPSLNALYWLLP